MKKIVFLTGAGMSAESGISTFRDSDGLWEKYPVEAVASIQGCQRQLQLPRPEHQNGILYAFADYRLRRRGDYRLRRAEHQHAMAILRSGLYTRPSQIQS